MKTQGYILGAVTGIAFLLWFQSQKKKVKVTLPLNLTKVNASDTHDAFIAYDAIAKSPTIRPKKKHKKAAVAKTFHTTQVTLTNHTNTKRSIQLWGGNTDTPITPSTDQDRINSATIAGDGYTTPVGTDPQGMVYNPANNYVYIANQLSNTVSVIDSQGTPVTTIEVGDFQSPVALAVNTLVDSPNYGKVYVVNSIADTVSVITTNFEIEATINVGLRPVAIAFNPVNAFLYVATIADDALSIIDTDTLEIVTTLEVEQEPRAIAIDSQNGNVYVSATRSNSVYVFDRDGNFITLLRLVNQPTGLLVVPQSNRLYVVSSQDNTLQGYSTLDFDLVSTTALGTNPYGIAYHEELSTIYVANRDDNSISVLDSDANRIGTIEDINIGLAVLYNPSTGDIITSATNGIEALRFVFSEPVSVNTGYYAWVEEFQYNPIQIKHLKMIFSSMDTAAVLELTHASIHGCLEKEQITLGEFTNPQNVNNKILEVTALNDTIIDGSARWNFDIAPQQTITLLLSYEQWQRKQTISPIKPTIL